MGWASGSCILAEIVDEIHTTELPYEARVRVYTKMIDVFEEYDCDTLEEIIDCATEAPDPAWVAAYRAKYPEEGRED